MVGGYNSFIIGVFGLIIFLLVLLTSIITYGSASNLMLNYMMALLNILIVLEFALLIRSNKLKFKMPNVFGIVLRVIVLLSLIKHSRPGDVSDYIVYYVFWILFFIQFTVFLFVKQLERD